MAGNFHRVSGLLYSSVAPLGILGHAAQVHIGIVLHRDNFSMRHEGNGKPERFPGPRVRIVLNGIADI